MIEITGDIFSQSYQDCICCTTNRIVKSNGELVMGAGVAKSFKRIFPDLPKHWGERLNQGLHDKGFMVSRHSKNSFANYYCAFPTKHDWKKPSDIKLIIYSTETLVKTANILGWTKILLPRPGCANGGLEWEYVRDVIGDLLDERFTVISL